MRAGNPRFDRGMSARFTRWRAVHTILAPQLDNGATAAIGIALVPYRDIAFDQLTGIAHRHLSSAAMPLKMGARPSAVDYARGNHRTSRLPAR
jgi:hypothetical protein